MSIAAATLLDRLDHHVLTRPDDTAYTFLENGEREQGSWSFRDLQCHAHAVAHSLAMRRMAGETFVVALVFQPGLAFLAAFFGCLYAGVIAVPLHPPRRREDLALAESILRASGTRLILTDTATAGMLEKFELPAYLPPLEVLSWLEDGADIRGRAEAYRPRRFGAEAVAFLQFTSGSTATPKGVIVTHGNLMNNQEVICAGFGHDEQTTVVGWLPFYHDMGLVGIVLQPLYVGRPCVLMSPAAFVQKPVRWLRALSQYRATTSGGPNFGYELCAGTVTDKQLSQQPLDLSQWQVAFTGAEPIRPATLDLFAARFASCGFSRRAFYPCYGMSETTLMLTGIHAGTGPTALRLDAERLKGGEAHLADSDVGASAEIVSCGVARLGNSIVIVNPETCTPLPDGQIGEIWAHGPSIAAGYWQNPEATQEHFRASLPGRPETHYLRTGDLGFLRDGELYITGRLKSLIIVNGRNYYPHDIEATLLGLHPAFRPRSAVFQTEGDHDSRIVLIQEIYTHMRGQISEASAQAIIRKAVTAHHGIALHEVVLTTRRLPVTTSGKIRRAACREAWLAGAFASANIPPTLREEEQ